MFSVLVVELNVSLHLSVSPPIWLWASLLAAALRFQSWLGKQMRSKQSVRQSDSQSD